MFGAKSASDCLRFAKFRPLFANFLAQPIIRTENCLVHFKVHLVLQHIAKTVSKSMHNWRRYPSSNWYKIDQKMRSAVAPSDATEKNRNTGAQLQSLLCTSAPIYLGKFTSYDFWCAQTCSFGAILGLPVRNLTIAAGAT